jgi:uncharacterized protein (TIGR00251 family)
MASGGAGRWLSRTGNGLRIDVLARPGASRSGCLGVEARGLVIALHAPPEDGRANRELIEMLARILRLPRASVRIVRGTSSRQKTIEIATASPDRVATRFEELARGGSGAGVDPPDRPR